MLRRLTRRCFCHYEGRTAANYPSGDKFDSSYDRGQPAKFAPNQVIRGWTEAMQMMVEGDKWELYIPPRCASIRECGTCTVQCTAHLADAYTLRMLRALHLFRLAYGARGRPPKIPGHSVLVFTIEIKRITGNRRPKVAAVEL